MSLLDFILNLAGLLLWVSWRYVPFDPLSQRRPATLTGTLRSANRHSKLSRSFMSIASLVALFALLFLRGLFYWWLGEALEWTPGINLGAITIAFRSDLLWRMMLFSVGSFASTLLLFYGMLILLSVVHGRDADAEPCVRFLRIQLGAIHGWPAWLKVLLPALAAGLAWLACEPFLARMGIVPRAQTWSLLLQQAGVLSLSTYPPWKHLIGAVLVLHLLNNYIYFGNHPVWGFINTTARRLLQPLGWTPRIGMADFTPLVGIALVFVAAEFIQRGLTWLYPRLPLF
ncbi:MAG TPA: hypothetical protein VFV96_03130 [Verrucomicrobiae bacterium]|nr:hypothetical protein [Verrucomicrobiae bacterium]